MAKNKNHLIFAGSLLLIIFAVGALVYQQETILRNGETTILETRPVDPRDLFRGEYVILRYEVEQDEMIEEFAKGLQTGDRLYIRFAESDEGIASVAEVRDSQPASLEGLWIEGEVSGNGVRFPSLEQFYVPEGAGLPIERLGTNLHVEVSL